MKTTKRDLVFAGFLRASFVSVAVALGCLSLIAPLAYCYVMAAAVSVAIIGGGCVVSFWMSRDNIVGSWFAMDLMTNLLRAVGMIFLALAQAGAGTND